MNSYEAARQAFLKGIDCLEKQEFTNAEKFFTETLKHAPRSIPTLINLAIVQCQEQRFDEASQTARRAITIDPNNLDAYSILSTCQKAKGQYEEVVKTCDKIISIDPPNADSHSNRGFALAAIGRHKEAIESYDRAIAIEPNFANAFLNRGNSLQNLKCYDEALVAFDKAIALKPDSAEAWLGRGNVSFDVKRCDDAFSAYDKALALNADLADAWLGRGNVFFHLRDYDDAFAAYGKALALKSDLAEAWLGRGNVFLELKRYDDALAAYDKAVALKGKLAAAWLGRGNVFTEIKRYDEAFASYDKALALKPDLAEGWLGRGDVFNKLKRYEEAALADAEVLKIDPRHPFTKGRLLHHKMLSCDWREIDDLIAEIDQDVAARRLSAEPFGWQGIAESPQSLKLCAELFNSERYPADTKTSFRRPPVTINHRRIRIGYSSGELREHATSHLMAGVLELHDSSRFEIFGVDNGWDDQSDLRRRINASLADIIDIRRLSDASAAAAIRENRIDILVNLNGYFGEERTGVFARRPAPIQINYLGFPGTLGASYIDYIIADRHVIPPSHVEFYTEKVIYLPNCYQANDRKRKIGTHIFNRAECGLPEEGFVFCCFNNNYKIMPDTFSRWMRILSRVDGSVLWLLEDNGSAAWNLRRQASASGINPNRLVFAKRIAVSDHLARHSLADLFLDTLPYNAHTTASDALWAALPVLTQIGGTFAGRVAASLLNGIGLAELITSTPQAYEDLAIELALSPDKLAYIKQKLGDNRLTTPLFDTRLFTRHIEAAYTAMFERHKAGLPPDHIYVPH
jgi:protein O-GlcNAc transferase